MRSRPPERNPSLPDVPTTKEAGLPEFEASAWNALFAPKGTPKPVVDKLSDALSKALDDEGVRKRLLDLGSDIPDGPRRGPRGARHAGEERSRQVGQGDQGGGRGGELIFATRVSDSERPAGSAGRFAFGQRQAREFNQS